MTPVTEISLNFLQRGSSTLARHSSPNKSNSSFRYIVTFDRDRLALEGAYTPESTFSARYIPISHSSPLHYLSRCNTSTLQGHSHIIQSISSFSQRISFVSSPKFPPNVTIDVVRLPDTAYLVTTIFNTTVDDVHVSVDMVFILKESARLTGKRDLLRILWSPFIVVSHQIILRS